MHPCLIWTRVFFIKEDFMRYQKPKGTMDILPGDSEKWQYVESIAQDTFNKYRFSEIRTPIY